MPRVKAKDLTRLALEKLIDEVDVPVEYLETYAIRDWITQQLGGKCIKCGKGYKLNIHHVHGGGSLLRSIFGDRGELIRISQDLNSGHYALACDKCHGSLEPPTFYRIRVLQKRRTEALAKRFMRERNAVSGEAVYDVIVKYVNWQKALACKYDAVRKVKELYGIE